MTRRALAATLLLAVLLALAITARFVGGTEETIAPVLDAMAAPARGEPPANVPWGMPTPSPTSPADRRVVASDELRMQVRIIDEAGNAVPDARVRYTNHLVRDGENPRAVVESLDGDPWRTLGERCDETATDADGIARWPWSDRGGPWHVAANAGDRFVAETLTATARPEVVHELRLHPNRAFALQLVDPFGHGTAGVLAGRIRGGMYARSDADGRITFPHIPAQFAGSPLQLQVYAGAGLPPIQLDPDHLPTEPVVVPLPACGMLHFMVRDPFDHPIAYPLMLHLEVDGTTRETDDGPWCYTDQNGETQGIAVAIGRRFHVADEHGRHLDTIDGPKLPGETVDVVLHEAAGRYVTARLLLDGAPFARRDVQLDLFHGEARTDADGRLCCLEIGSKAELVLDDLTIRAADDDGNTYVARWHGRRRLTEGENDFGTLTVVREPQPPVLVSGRIECAIDDLDEVFLSLVTADADAVWKATVRTEIDHATGLFRMRANDPGKPLKLHASHTTMGNLELACAAGQHDLVVALLGGTRVVAAVVDVPAELDACLSFTLLQDGIERAIPDDPWDRERNGTRLELRWEDQEPGSYCLDVHVAGMPSPFLHVPALCVEQGKTCADPRLAAIHLPPLHVTHLRIATRERPNWRTANFAFADGERWPPSNRENGEFVFALTGPVTFDLTIDGHDPIHVVDLFEDRTLSPW